MHAVRPVVCSTLSNEQYWRRNHTFLGEATDSLLQLHAHEGWRPQDKPSSPWAIWSPAPASDRERVWLHIIVSELSEIGHLAWHVKNRLLSQFIFVYLYGLFRIKDSRRGRQEAAAGLGRMASSFNLLQRAQGGTPIKERAAAALQNSWCLAWH